MFSKDDIIFSYTTKQAVADGVLVKADKEQSACNKQ
jgi:type I site-specific restriction endonuclease